MQSQVTKCHTEMTDKKQREPIIQITNQALNVTHEDASSMFQFTFYNDRKRPGEEDSIASIYQTRRNISPLQQL